LDAENDIHLLQSLQEESSKRQEELDEALLSLKKENNSLRRELEESHHSLDYARKEAMSVEKELRMGLEKSQASNVEYLSTIHLRDQELEDVKQQLEVSNADQMRLKEDLQLV
jgi:precorrin-2 methylase